LNQSLKGFVEKGLISDEVAMSFSSVPEELAKMLGIKARGN